ncbi:MAG: hypothetical protein H7Z75_02230 [Ferruginibacter sp.]|nr:hypothetical protein [Cytophagales bacterium]
MEANHTKINPLFRPDARWVWLIGVSLLIPVGLVLLNRSRLAPEISQSQFLVAGVAKYSSGVPLVGGGRQYCPRDLGFG